jgi:hypothetical protein
VKRTFTLGSSTSRKRVVIDLNGTRLYVMQQKSDGTTKKAEKVLKSESDARSEAERMVRDLLAHGYVEQADSVETKAAPAKAAAKRASRPREPEGPSARGVFDLDDEPAAKSEPVLPRLAAAPAAGPSADGAPKKKKTGGKKKKKKKAESGDALDKRVLAGIFAVGGLLVLGLGYVDYDAFLKPPTIVGTWRGSMTEYEIGHAIIHTKYDLLLDEKKRASLTLQEKFTSVGTYSVKGDRLKLNLKDEADAAGAAGEDGDQGGGGGSEREYKFKLGRATLDLIDPESGKPVVQLIRFREEPNVKGAGAKKQQGPPASLAAAAVEKVDKAADERLAALELSPKDSAFKVRYPKGWEPDTGSRPDNTYSWASFTKGSAKIQVNADITGSLMSGSAAGGQFEEGSELAPVHNAHVLYERTVKEEYSDYKETKPTLFKGSPLGEGRISAFTASSGGILGSRLRGCRVTLLTNDRRISVLCHCPDGEFAKFQPTFLAVCRSLSR